MTDQELLAAFRMTRSEDAFRQIVDRYLNLVFGVARRQVGSPATAEEVAQLVFCDLARQIDRLDDSMPLVAWLHVVARRTAIDLVRREARRARRENEAATAAAMSKPPEPDWSAIEPLLDEAVESLKPADRSAVLLRYFHNKPLREIGRELGLSEDAAQKRVARALEQLRVALQRRGVAATAAGLAVELPIHAAEIAPAALGPTICSAAIAGAGLPLSGAATASQILTMSTVQKTVMIATLAIGISAGIGETAAAWHQQKRMDRLEQELASAAALERQTMAQSQLADAKLARVENEIDRRLSASLQSGSEAALVAQLQGWYARVDHLKKVVAEHPEWSAPELQLLSEDQWLAVAHRTELRNDAEVQDALSQLRGTASGIVMDRLSEALRAYQRTNEGGFPPDVSALVPFLKASLAPEILGEYHVLGSWYGVSNSEQDVGPVLLRRAPVDADRDRLQWYARNSNGSLGAIMADVLSAQRAFTAASGGRKPTAAVEIMPYLPWPASQAAVEREFAKSQKQSAK